MVNLYSSATELARYLRSGQLSSVELLEAFLREIETRGSQTNSVISICAEQALEQAAQADRELADGSMRGPLHGLPVTIKDAFETRGLRSTGGALELQNYIPERDATAVARLKSGGAIVFGKTNVPTWSSDLQTYNPIFGHTRNPWNLALSCGGSSGGSAAAVASGFTSFDLGSDIAGSIRIPAHLCGVYGLRPSFGLVPTDGYLGGPRHTNSELDMNTAGPIARSAEDLEMVLDVLAGPGTVDSRAWSVSLPEGPGRLSDFKIGVWIEDDLSTPLDNEYTAVLNEILAELKRVADIREVHPDLNFKKVNRTFEYLSRAARSFTGTVLGSSLSHHEWLSADNERHKEAAVWEDWFQDFDALLAPVISAVEFPVSAPAPFYKRYTNINERLVSYERAIEWRALVNTIGLPVVVAPIGFTSKQLPVGIQIISGRWRDKTAIKLAQHLKDITVGYMPPPAGPDITAGDCMRVDDT